MARITHILIASTYATAALFVCAMLIRFNLADIGGAWTLSALLALTAGQIHAMAAREMARDRMAAEKKSLTEIKRLMVEELASLRARIAEIEADMAEEGEERHAAVIAEVRTLEDLVHRLGDRVGERIVADRERGRRDGRASGAPAGRGSLEADRAHMLATVRDALADGRVDLHLQPIVTLPQRKTHFFESFSRLRDADGAIVMPAEWLRVAEPAGLVTEIDNLLLFRCVQIVRRLAEKERRVGIFCNISPASLADETFFPQFLDFVRRNSDLSDALIFEIGQDAFENRGLVAARNMTRLAEYGFRFSIDKVTELDVDLADLRRTGVKFMKAPGDLLLANLSAGEPLGISAAPEVNAEDYVALLAKYGVELIAEKVEQEATVLELLDLDVGLAQGHLFGAPRPIREEILEQASRGETTGEDAEIVLTRRATG